MEIEQNIWGFTSESEAIVLYTMRNKSGSSVKLTNIGAAVVSIEVPDKDGVLADVVAGYGDFQSYMNDAPHMGKTVGRYANRIGRGTFTLDDVVYRLPQNVPPNHLHGGPAGFSTKIWGSRVETDRVVFSLVSPDGDQGYPAELGVEVVYDWSDDCELAITLYARSNASTVVNLTNHTYFNLRGESSGSVLGHTLRLNASRYLPTTAMQIPTGEFATVEGTPMDFRQPKQLLTDIDADFEPLKIGGGYDHCWIIDEWEQGRLCEVGTLVDPVSGRKMSIRSTQPGVQIYTGNWLQGCPKSKSGHEYENRDAVAIECQGLPDAPNHPQFPSQRLDKEQIYQQIIIYKFYYETV